MNKIDIEKYRKNTYYKSYIKIVQVKYLIMIVKIHHLYPLYLYQKNSRYCAQKINYGYHDS